MISLNNRISGYYQNSTEWLSENLSGFPSETHKVALRFFASLSGTALCAVFQVPMLYIISLHWTYESAESFFKTNVYSNPTLAVALTFFASLSMMASGIFLQSSALALTGVGVGVLAGCFYYGAYNRIKFKEELDQWINDPSATGDKSAAAKSIESALSSYYNYSTCPSLILQNMGLNKFPACIGRIDILSHLSLSKNSITELPGNFENLKLMIDLDLSFNLLNELPDSIYDFRLLRYLKLSNNNLTSLSSKIENFSELECLDLSGNRLCELPKEIVNLKSLYSLDLRGNPLVTFPSRENYLFRAVSLRLDSDQISLDEVTLENLSAFTGLKKNDILTFENNLRAWTGNPNIGGDKNRAAKLIRDDFYNTSYKDKELMLSNLQLTSLPSCIGMICGLETLNLSNNLLQELPDEIVNLTSLRVLYLKQNLFKTVPPEIYRLQNLTKLNLTENPIQSLPETLGRLSNLSSLHIDSNQLSLEQSDLAALSSATSLESAQILNFEKELRAWEGNTEIPGNKKKAAELIREAFYNTRSPNKSLNLYKLNLTEIPSFIKKISGLEELRLSHNNLESLPDEICDLAALKILWIDRNSLKYLPDRIGLLCNLRSIYLDNNPELGTLPMSLGQIPGITYLSVENTNISIDDRDQILEMCKMERMKEAAEKLPAKLAVWKAYGESSEDLAGIAQFNINEKISLYEWLCRLERTKDFTRCQKWFTHIVCEIAATVIADEEFRNTFFGQIGVNLERCPDRAAMSLNETYTCWMLCKISQKEPKEKLEFMVRAAKTFALRNAIGSCIDKRQKETGNIERESVEIYLYYETLLKEKLNLLSAVNHMLFKSIGERDWISSDQLEKIVEETYVDRLVDLPDFEQYLIVDANYNKQKKNINKSAYIEMQAIEKKRPKTSNENAPEMLDWNIEMNVAKDKREKALKELRKIFYTQIYKK